MTPQGEAVAKIEVTLTEPRPGGGWAALIKPLRKLREGEEIGFRRRSYAPGSSGSPTGRRSLSFNLTGEDFDAALRRGGRDAAAALHRRPARPPTRRTATITRPSSPAMPGPSPRRPHRCISTMSCWPRLRAKGVAFTHVTLHVGAGTFLPVKVDDVTDAQDACRMGRGDGAGRRPRSTRRARRAGGSSRSAPPRCA